MRRLQSKKSDAGENFSNAVKAFTEQSKGVGTGPELVAQDIEPSEMMDLRKPIPTVDF